MPEHRKQNHIFQYFQRLHLVGALLIVQYFCVFASDPPQFVFDSWTTDNGLPQASINSILQTRDGFLWFTTFGGLVRYDGLRFQVFTTGNTKGLKTSRFLQLYEDRNGALWIANEQHGVTRYQDETFTTYSAEHGLPAGRIRFHEDSDGNLLANHSTGNENSDFRWTGEGFTPHVRPGGGPSVNVWYRTPKAVWSADDNRLRKIENGQITVNFPVDFSVKRLFEDSSGRLWVAADGTTTLFMFSDGAQTSYSTKDGLFDARYLVAYEDRQKRIWFGSVAGLDVFQDGKFTGYTTADGLTRGDVTAIYQDREGIIWVGTTGGLTRITPRVAASYSVQDGLAGENVYSIYQDRNGKIWIGSWFGLTVYENGKFEDVSKRFGLAEARITSFYEDREGNFWVGTLSHGASRIKDGQVMIYPPGQLQGTEVRAVYQDRVGNVWFGTKDGLIKFKDKSFTKHADMFSGEQILTLREDLQGRLWIGTTRGLTIYQNGTFTRLAEKEGFAGGTVRAFAEDPDGTLWIGMYDSGLYRFKDGKFTRYTTNEGLFDNGAFQILEDDRGNLWMSCNLGIYRVKKSELNDYAEGRISKVTSVPYNKRDGMLNSECNGGTQPAGIRASDGRLWFPTQQGVAVINPETASFDTPPPPVVIESVIIEGQPVDIRRPVEIQPKQTYIEIHYAGLSFLNPELVKFKYRLEGLSDDWIDAGTRRTAYYTHLPPGEYVFRVAAANREGVWNETGTVVKIKVIPSFWQTRWFLASIVVIIVAAGFLIYYFRVSALKQRHATQEAFSRRLIESQEAERKRIAGELHDGLGQSLVVIKNRALIGLNAPDNHERVLSQVEEIAEAASAAISEVRDIARNLHPHQLDHLGLKTALETMIRSVESASKIEFSSDIDETESRISKEAEINLYRVVQESLSNIVKHSEASKAGVSLKINGQVLTLTINDNGKSFEQGAEKINGGLGLVGIGERAKILGARYEIRSAPEKGTNIFLQMNLLPPEK